MKQGLLTCRRMLCLLVLLGGAWPPHPAWADWGEAGAQYLCDSKSRVFELLPYDRSSDDPAEGIHPKPGYKEIPQGAPPFVCALGAISLHLVIDVYPPASHGQGMGAGFVRARSMAVSDVELLPDSPAFDWSIDPQTPPLTRLRVEVAKPGTLRLDRCYSQGTPGETCDTKDVPIASLVEAQADLLRPADLVFQREHSATKAPLELDYAHAFETHDRIPVCAHLSSSFLRGVSMATPTEPIMITRSGRIAGKPGDRVYLRPANPEVCDASAEPKCRGKSYLIPGDHVDVGFICGAWTYIRYTPRTHAAGTIVAWVPTTDLYNVDATISTKPHPKESYPRGTTTDPLMLAVGGRELDKVKSLIAAGANPDGAIERVREFYTPLAMAIHNDDLNIVDVLLTAGASSNNPGVLAEALLASVSMWEELRRFNLNPHALPLIQLATSNRIDANEELAEQTGRWQPVSNLPALFQRAIAAGAPVDEVDHQGNTALAAATRGNSVDVAQVLLKSNANPNREVDGQSILMVAMSSYSSHHDPTMIIQLLEAGAAPNFRTNGDYIAAESDGPPGACCPDAGQTALTIAADSGDLTLVKILLTHGADASIPRSDGALAADIARSNHHLAAAKLIEEHMNNSKTGH